MSEESEGFQVVNVDPMTGERTVLYSSPVRPVLRNGEALTWTWTETLIPDDDAPD